VNIFDNLAVNDSQVAALLKLIGARLRKLREAKGWSQEGAADASSIPRTKYRAIEAAERHYGIDALLKVLQTFDIDILELFNGRAKRLTPKYADPEHQRLHEELQELLEAPGAWPTVAAVNVDSVFLNYQNQKKK
jgi:transcriptional regulator with XRE-family HTH domain